MSSTDANQPSIFSVWEGVYSSFAEAGGDLDIWSSDLWIEKQRSKIMIALERYENKNFVFRDYALPLVVAMLITGNERISVLDFGGGMGQQYLEVVGTVPAAQDKMDYFIVDGKA